MFRARANRTKALFVSKLGLIKRPYSNYYQPLPRVPLLGPALWSVAACSTIYLGCAAYDVYRDTQRARLERSRWPHYKQPQDPTFEDLERLADRRSTSTASHYIGGTTADAERLTVGVMSLAAGVHLATRAVPTLAGHFMHTPALSGNYSLLTSVFGHAGLLHLGFNMYGMLQLIPSAARCPTFRDNSAHLSAFYLSAGILSSLASHATAVWPERSIYRPTLGASGALLALFGIVGISYPDIQVGVLLIPGSFPIANVMACVALFDAIGLFVRYPYISLAHSAHLSGLALGVVYARYCDNQKIWRTSRKTAFRAMRSLGVI
ncbi:putative presenilins-associated rhomboid-like mitochondrial-like protein [Rosellinia necatrix]|uniref:Putative presenilins-associated rhomboid-like mitochondrial-like protein n=1 Tax=Rosellinia necatrix TaxID=77044 RepID=A0A1W2TW28_ROSNE|nr:putative presenilins-associated rhomboid-like mitochondrial-like protein [Rosellinia necatrix]